jgi:hypothetical protein
MFTPVVPYCPPEDGAAVDFVDASAAVAACVAGPRSIAEELFKMIDVLMGNLRTPPTPAYRRMLADNRHLGGVYLLEKYAPWTRRLLCGRVAGRDYILTG